MNLPAQALVLGIGNLLWADEGFGVRAVEALHARYAFPESVTLMDGGTQGLRLLDAVSSADAVLVFDAVDYRLPPGSLKILRDEDVPAWSDTAMSLHQATFMELLSVARLQGRFPARITVIGVQAAVLDDLGGSLSSLVRSRLDEAVEMAARELSEWGFQPLRRTASPAAPLNASALGLAPYEDERPDAAAACRIGDSRFMNQVAHQRVG
jgi:hydrogenase maturation protease